MGIDTREEPTAVNRLLIKNHFLGSGPKKRCNNVQFLKDDRRKALFRSFLSNPVAKWFESLEASITWNKIKTQFIARFTEGEMQYCFWTEAANLKRQPDGNKKIDYLFRNKTLVDKRWPSPSNDDTDARTAWENQRVRQCKVYFVVSLTHQNFTKKLTMR